MRTGAHWDTMRTSALWDVGRRLQRTVQRLPPPSEDNADSVAWAHIQRLTSSTVKRVAGSWDILGQD